jgi:hypothetical protein
VWHELLCYGAQPMRKIFLIFLAAFGLAVVPFAFSQNDSYDHTDAFEYTNLEVIPEQSSPVAYSATQTFDLRDMFGGTFGNYELYNTIFGDIPYVDGVDVTTWKMHEGIALHSYAVYMSRDGVVLPNREASFFRLLADVDEDGTFETVFHQGVPDYIAGAGVAKVSATNQTPITARLWRAEFHRTSNVLAFTANPAGGTILGRGGVRVVELDGYAVPNPDHPEVSLLNPDPSAETRQKLVAPASIQLKANASDSDDIARVEYFTGDTRLGSSTKGPDYPLTWENLSEGTYSVKAVAVDKLGWRTESLIGMFEVAPPSVPPPTIQNVRVVGDKIQFQVINLVADRDYVIQISTDLSRWDDDLQFTAGSEIYDFVDARQIESGQKMFFRAKAADVVADP